MLFQHDTPINRLLNLAAVSVSGGKLVEDTATGNPLTFTTEKAKPLRSLLIPFTPTQSGTGDPSPDNVRPITGWTGVNVWRTGKNVFNYDANKVTTGETSTGTTRSYYPLGLKGCKLSFSASSIDTETRTNSNINIGKLKDGIVTIINSFIETIQERNRQVTFSDDEEAVLISSTNSPAGITTNIPKYNIQIEVGETATPYAPYIGETIPVDWTDEAGTVYGGTLDLITGELWQTWEKAGLKGQSWSNYSANRVFAANFHKNKTGGLYSDSFKTKIGNPTEDLQIGYYTNGANYAVSVYFCKDGMTSPNEFNEWLNDLEFDPYICFEMETPVLVATLTPQQITALVGNNTIWSDTNGENTVVYLKKA